MRHADVKRQLKEFWDHNPCGAKFAANEIGSPEFFRAVEAFRYQAEPHILEICQFSRYRGKRVLEIGCGLGTDGTRFAEAGALYWGLEHSPKSISLARRNFELRGISGQFTIADAEDLPFEDSSFDLVYSHGVLHHTPMIRKAINEIHRVLRPHGELKVMLYHRNSWNYYGNIMFLRRLGAALLLLKGGVELVHRLTGEDIRRLEVHRQMLRRKGLDYLRSSSWLSSNTDGAGNPLSQAFTRREGIALFRRFSNVYTQTRFLNRAWVPIVGKHLSLNVDNMLGRIAGWHLYIMAEK